MKNIFYAIIPAAAFLLILSNALFGHLLFASDAEQVANKYSIYVHFQPEWNSHPKNLIFDVTNSWSKAGSDGKTETGGESTYNANQLQYVDGKSFVELKHDFSECQDEWMPILYRRAIDAVRHEIEYLQGSQLSADPEISVYPDVPNKRYDSDSQRQKIKDGYAQFIPICTSSEVTSYDYSVKIDGDAVGFDAYFVSSEQERHAFYSADFASHSGPGCSAENKKSFSGTCEGIGRDGGLLVVIPDELNAGVTKVTVNLYEKT